MKEFLKHIKENKVYCRIILFVLICFFCTLLAQRNTDNAIRVGNNGLYVQGNEEISFTYDTIYVKDAWNEEMKKNELQIFHDKIDTTNANNIIRDCDDENYKAHAIYTKRIVTLELDSLTNRKKELENDSRQYSNEIQQINITGVIIFKRDN